MKVLTIMLAVVLGFCGGSNAQEAKFKVASVDIQILPWTFTPAMTDDTCAGFLGWMNPDLAVGQNIAVIWCERNQDGQWEYWAWSDNDIGEAVAWVRLRFDDPLIFRGQLGKYVVERMKSGRSNEVPEDPDKLVDGMFEWDIMRKLLSASPIANMHFMAKAGFKVAPMLSEMMIGGSVCPNAEEDATLDTFMDSAEQSVVETLLGFAPPTECQWPCKCQRQKTDWVSSGAWTITSYVVQGRKKCEYTRPASRDYSDTGRTFLCPSCKASGTCTGHEYGAVDVEIGELCPAEPGYGTEFVGDNGC